MSVSTGSPMQLVNARARLAKQDRPGRMYGSSQLGDRIPEIRKLLRSDLSLANIAAQLGVGAQSLRRIIKQRNLCDLRARRDFNTLQRSLVRLDKESDQ